MWPAETPNQLQAVIKHNGFLPLLFSHFVYLL